MPNNFLTRAWQLTRFYCGHFVLPLLAGVLTGAATPALAGIGAALSQPEIEYGYPEQPPHAYTNAQGQAVGSYPRLLNMLFKQAGIAWHGASYPDRRLMANLDNGTTSFSIQAKNPQLANCCLYGKTPVWYDELRVYHRAATPTILRKEDLIGKRVAVLAGFSYGGLIDFIDDPQHRIDKQLANSHVAAFEMLDSGRADYLLDYADPANSEGLAKHPIADLRSLKIDTVYMYFVINKNYPDAAYLLNRLEALYLKMREADIKREYTR